MGEKISHHPVPRNIENQFDIIRFIPNGITAWFARQLLPLISEGFHIVSDPPDIVNDSGRYSPDLIALRNQHGRRTINTIVIENTSATQPTLKYPHKAKQVRVLGSEMKDHDDSLAILFSGIQKKFEKQIQDLLLQVSRGDISRQDCITRIKQINPQSGPWDKNIKLNK